MNRFEVVQKLGYKTLSDQEIMKLYFECKHSSPELRQSYEYAFTNAPEKVQNTTRNEMCESIIKAVTAKELKTPKQYSLVYNSMKAVARKYSWYVALCVFQYGEEI